jgi:repressor LexA
MRAELTQRQDEMYQFLLNQREQCGVCPTREEIRQHFGFRSQNSVQEHLRLLEQKGFIKRSPRKARSIQLTAPGQGRDLHDLSSCLHHAAVESGVNVPFSMLA